MIRFTHLHNESVAKRYDLVDGALVKSHADPFRSGPYQTKSVQSVEELATFLEQCTPGDLLLAGINSDQTSGQIGFGEGSIRRTKENFPFVRNKPGVFIIDSDNLPELGINSDSDFNYAISRLLGESDYCTSPSASSNVSAGDVIGTLRGVHTFCFVHDAARIPEMLVTLHKRSVLMGYAYPFVTQAGIIFIRSLVDTAMKTPNQLCYEGGAILGEGVSQVREISYWQHGASPSFLEVKPLSDDEEKRYEEIAQNQIRSAQDIAAESRERWLQNQQSALEKRGCRSHEIERILDGITSSQKPVLSGSFEIHTDEFGVKTVGELLDQPDIYHGATCADPLDPHDGPNKAKIYLNNAVNPAINSFAHGGNVYLLTHEFSASLIPDNQPENTQNSVEVLEICDRTDAGNVAVLYQMTSGNLRYLPGRQEFIYWNSSRWLSDEFGTMVHEVALEVASHYATRASTFKEESEEPDTSEQDADRLEKVAQSYSAWSKQCRSKQKIDSMIGLAKRDKRFVLNDSELDQNPKLLGVLNGVVNLERGSLEADCQSDYITKRCSVAFVPEAEACRWKTFISEITSHNGRIENGQLVRVERPHLALYLQKLLGYCLTGLTIEQIMIIMHGVGSNGKNILLDTVLEIMGDYAQDIPSNLLMDKKFDSNPENATPSLRKLAGARLAIGSESKEEQKLETALVKKHSGGGYITARGLHQSPVTFPITHKFILMTNFPPVIEHMDPAMQGRINLVPFDMKWNRPGEIHPDPNLPDAQKDLMQVLKGEHEGILSWMIAGAVLYFKEGLQPPGEVKASTRAYIESQDSMMQWLRLYGTCEPSCGELAGELYRHYETYCRSEELTRTLHSAASLAKRLKARGIPFRKSREGMRYGLSLLDENTSQVDTDFDFLMDIDTWYDSIREEQILSSES